LPRPQLRQLEYKEGCVKVVLQASWVHTQWHTRNRIMVAIGLLSQAPIYKNILRVGQWSRHWAIMARLVMG